MRAKDILEHFLSRASWVDRASTVDRIIIGDPGKEVRRCLVMWMPSFAGLREAAARGADAVVCHEPTFWEHRDDHPENRLDTAAKAGFIRNHALVIVRNHDCWDRWPQLGIPWSWARFLGLGHWPAVDTGYHHRYDIEPVRFEEFARRVASRTAAVGEPAIEVTGDPDQPVSKIGIGTGCGCDVWQFIDMGCDCSILCDDGSYYWRHVQYAADRGHPVICVNHATCEEPGMVTLTRYINEHLDGVTAEHLAQGCRFRRIGGEGCCP